MSCCGEVKTSPGQKTSNLYPDVLTVSGYQVGPTKHELEFDPGIDPAQTIVTRAAIKYTVTPDSIPFTNDYFSVYLNGQLIISVVWAIYEPPPWTRTGEAIVDDLLNLGKNNLTIQVDRTGFISGVNFSIDLDLILEYSGAPPNPTLLGQPIDLTGVAITMAFIGLGLAGVAIVAKAIRPRAKTPEERAEDERVRYEERARELARRAREAAGRATRVGRAFIGGLRERGD